MWISYALLAALSFGVRGVFYQWTSQQNLNRSLMLCGVFFTGFVFSLPIVLLNPPDSVSAVQIMVGLAMGVLSYSANASLYKGYAVGKASLVSVLAGLPPLFVVLIAFIVWRETLTQIQLSSFVIIFIGIYLIRYSNDLSLKNLKGAQWGLLAALFFGLNDIMGKQSTRLETDLFFTMLLMFGMGSFLFLISWLQSKNRRNAKADSLPWSLLKTFGVGMAIGTTNVGGMVAILTAFSAGPTGMVSAIASLNLLVVLAYTRFILHIPFRKIELAGIAAAVAGVVILRLF